MELLVSQVKGWKRCLRYRTHGNVQPELNWLIENVQLMFTEICAHISEEHIFTT